MNNHRYKLMCTIIVGAAICSTIFCHARPNRKSQKNNPSPCSIIQDSAVWQSDSSSFLHEQAITLSEQLEEKIKQIASKLHSDADTRYKALQEEALRKKEALEKSYLQQVEKIDVATQKYAQELRYTVAESLAQAREEGVVEIVNLLNQADEEMLSQRKKIREQVLNQLPLHTKKSWKLTLSSDFHRDISFIKNIVLDAESDDFKQEFISQFDEYQTWFDTTLANTATPRDEPYRDLLQRKERIEKIKHLQQQADLMLQKLTTTSPLSERDYKQCRLIILYELNSTYQSYNHDLSLEQIEAIVRDAIPTIHNNDKSPAMPQPATPSALQSKSPSTALASEPERQSSPTDHQPFAKLEEQIGQLQAKIQDFEKLSKDLMAHQAQSAPPQIKPIVEHERKKTLNTEIKAGRSDERCLAQSKTIHELSCTQREQQKNIAHLESTIHQLKQELQQTLSLKKAYDDLKKPASSEQQLQYDQLITSIKEQSKILASQQTSLDQVLAHLRQGASTQITPPTPEISAPTPAIASSPTVESAPATPTKPSPTTQSAPATPALAASATPTLNQAAAPATPAIPEIPVPALQAPPATPAQEIPAPAPQAAPATPSAPTLPEPITTGPLATPASAATSAQVTPPASVTPTPVITSSPTVEPTPATSTTPSPTTQSAPATPALAASVTSTLNQASPPATPAIPEIPVPTLQAPSATPAQETPVPTLQAPPATPAQEIPAPILQAAPATSSAPTLPEPITTGPLAAPAPAATSAQVTPPASVPPAPAPVIASSPTVEPTPATPTTPTPAAESAPATPTMPSPTTQSAPATPAQEIPAPILQAAPATSSAPTLPEATATGALTAPASSESVMIKKERDILQKERLTLERRLQDALHNNARLEQEYHNKQKLQNSIHTQQLNTIKNSNTAQKAPHPTSSRNDEQVALLQHEIAQLEDKQRKLDAHYNLTIAKERLQFQQKQHELERKVALEQEQNAHIKNNLQTKIAQYELRNEHVRKEIPLIVQELSAINHQLRQRAAELEQQQADIAATTARLNNMKADLQEKNKQINHAFEINQKTEYENIIDQKKNAEHKTSLLDLEKKIREQSSTLQNNILDLTSDIRTGTESINKSFIEQEINLIRQEERQAVVKQEHDHIYETQKNKISAGKRNVLEDELALQQEKEQIKTIVEILTRDDS